MTDPELLAEWLIRRGWGKRSEAFTGGVISATNAINAIQVSLLRPMVRPTLTRKEAVE